jgi:beta-lactamase class D
VRRFILQFFAIISFCSCSSQNKKPTQDAVTINSNLRIYHAGKSYFDACGVDGAIAIFDKNNQQWIVSDTHTVKTENLPASTFKIINLLIALETKTIKDENEVLKWVGSTDTVKYGYRPEIYRDMSVKEAFGVSAGWVFIELAKKIGKTKYQKYLSACNYGNLNLSEKNDDFWNFGDFAISPVNQVEFIRALYEEKLPFSKRNMAIVKNVMKAEETAGYTIGAKTGWTRDKGINTGWWVGYVEANNNTYFFATRLLQDRRNNRDDFGSCRKQITKRIFNDLGFIHVPGEAPQGGSAYYTAIDHIPIVVNDLGKIKAILRDQLFFTIKEGKPHEGINNCFVKFQDGTYLECISPTDSTKTIGKYYTNCLKERQGGTSLAISITGTDVVRNMLDEKHIRYTYDNNGIWRTIEPENAGLFFIDYADKNWKESSVNTTHVNNAISLSAIYMLTDNMEAAVREYARLGITETESGEYAATPYKLFTIGKSSLYVLDGTKSGKINQLLNTKSLQGICGFQVKVRSLSALNKQLQPNQQIIYEKNRTTVYVQGYNFFLTFTE